MGVQKEGGHGWVKEGVPECDGCSLHGGWGTKMGSNTKKNMN